MNADNFKEFVQIGVSIVLSGVSPALLSQIMQITQFFVGERR